MLWNPVAGTHVGILVGHTAAVTDVSYSPDGRLLLSTSRAGAHTRPLLSSSTRPLHSRF